MATVLHANPEDDAPLTGNRSAGGASSSRSRREKEDELMRPRWKLPGLKHNAQPKRPHTPHTNMDHVKSSGYGHMASRPLTHADLAADLEVAQDQLSFQHALAEASAEQIRFLEASQATTTAEFHEKEAKMKEGVATIKQRLNNTLGKVEQTETELRESRAKVQRLRVQVRDLQRERNDEGDAISTANEDFQIRMQELREIETQFEGRNNKLATLLEQERDIQEGLRRELVVVTAQLEEAVARFTLIAPPDPKDPPYEMHPDMPMPPAGRRRNKELADGFGWLRIDDLIEVTAARADALKEDAFEQAVAVHNAVSDKILGPKGEELWLWDIFQYYCTVGMNKARTVTDKDMRMNMRQFGRFATDVMDAARAKAARTGGFNDLATVPLSEVDLLFTHMVTRKKQTGGGGAAGASGAGGGADGDQGGVSPRDNMVAFEHFLQGLVRLAVRCRRGEGDQELRKVAPGVTLHVGLPTVVGTFLKQVVFPNAQTASATLPPPPASDEPPPPPPVDEYAEAAAAAGEFRQGLPDVEATPVPVVDPLVEGAAASAPMFDDNLGGTDEAPLVEGEAWSNNLFHK